MGNTNHIIRRKLAQEIEGKIVQYTSAIEKGGITKYKFSVWLADEFKSGYNYLSGLYTKQKGECIRTRLIKEKIEVAKRMLLDGKNCGDISFILEFSSKSHLTTCFKNVTGITPRYFRKSAEEFSKP